MKYLLKGLCLFIFLTTASLSFAETRVYFSPNGGCAQAIIAEINKAHESIDIAMFALTSREITKAIVAAKERHVKVRITLDQAQLKDHYSKSRYLMKREIPIRFHMGQGLMHDKFAVIDDKEVLTGSYNWTMTAEKKNSENFLIINDKEVAHQYRKEFKHLWSQSGEGQ